MVQMPMAAIFDKDDLASPIAYNARQTALIFLDFQGFTIDICGTVGMSALAKAKQLREWACQHDVLVLHSIVDVNSRPGPACKGAQRILKLLEGLEGDPNAAREASDLSNNYGSTEHVVLKPAGVVSGLMSLGARTLLVEHNIKSLILAGLSTSGAVLRTAAPAADDGFVVSVIHDACADPKEGVHSMLVDNVLPVRANVASADQFIFEWNLAWH